MFVFAKIVYICALKASKTHIYKPITLIFNTFIMEKLIAQIKAQLAAISADIDKVENKAAKARVRKATLALEKLGKEYRKVSVK